MDDGHKLLNSGKAGSIHDFLVTDVSLLWPEFSPSLVVCVLAWFSNSAVVPLDLRHFVVSCSPDCYAKNGFHLGVCRS